MNREIKFRGFSKELNTWVYGFLQEVDVEGIGYSYIFWQGNTTFVEANSVGQFTNLYDKNEKEIYESDLVVEGNSKPEIVKWEEKASCSCCNTASGFYWSKDEAKYIEVVGNYFENSDLLQSS